MRLWAEEKKSGTMELLMTLPINDYEAVIGKFLAVLTFLAITLGLTLPTSLTVVSLGNPDAGEIFGSYLGAILFGGALLAIGSFLSSLTKNQIVAFLVTVVCSFVLMVLGMDYVLVPVGGLVATVLNFVSISAHYNSLTRGLIDIGDLVYFIGFIFFFLFLNVKVLQSRYYKG
jgi:ABC-2 type transport system permease protein